MTRLRRLVYLAMGLMTAAATASAQRASPWRRDFQQSDGRAPIASSPVIEVKGKITRVQVGYRRGMPFLEVDDGGRAITVLLGPPWYLIEKYFSPKVGATVEVKGYKWNDGVMASTVRLPSENKTIQLRDKDGWPTWQSACCGRSRR